MQNRTHDPNLTSTHFGSPKTFISFRCDFEKNDFLINCGNFSFFHAKFIHQSILSTNLIICIGLLCDSGFFVAKL